LHAQYLNPSWPRSSRRSVSTVLRARRGCYLYDDEAALFGPVERLWRIRLGRSHPILKDALRQAIDADLPNMVQMDCALLPGLLANSWSRAVTPVLNGRLF